MIVSVVSVPATPLLIPEVAAGAAVELDAVRADCRMAITAFGAHASRAVVVARGARSRDVTDVGPANLTGLGLPAAINLGARSLADVIVEPADGTEDPSMGVAVGAWLLAFAEWGGERAFVEVDGGRETSAHSIRLAAEGAPTIVIAIADGSAGRTEKAPAALLPGAGEFDDRLRHALRTADLAWFLADERLDEAAALSCSGMPVWAAVAAALGSAVIEAREISFTDPYGVGYPVAAWSVT